MRFEVGKESNFGKHRVSGFNDCLEVGARVADGIVNDFTFFQVAP